MSYQWRKNSADERTGVDDGQKVEGEIGRSADDAFGEDGNIEVWCIQPAEEKEESYREKGKGDFFEGAGFEQRSRFFGDGPRTEDDETDELGEEDDECDYASCPAEPKSWLQSPEDDWVEDPACSLPSAQKSPLNIASVSSNSQTSKITRTRNQKKDIHTQTPPRTRQPHRQRPFRTKIRRHNRHARHIQTPQPQSCTHALGQKDLPPPRSETRHHQSKKRQAGAGDNKRADISSIVHGTHDDAEKDEEKGLGGTDPGD
ncbi:MAG: hypothetical protein Q9168_008369 [Polycauliona sp. 1 TL-2023]